MAEKRYLPCREIRKHFSVAPQTLRRWANTGRVEALRSSGGESRPGPRLYSFNDVAAILNAPTDVGCPTRSPYVYARVASAEQRASGDLARQIATLKEAEPNATIISDVASGLTWKRKGFRRLLDAVYDRKVSRIVVTDHERLSRFDLDLLRWLFAKTGTELVVLRPCVADYDAAATNELAADFFAVARLFVGKDHGRRSQKRKRKTTHQEEEKDDGSKSTTQTKRARKNT